MKKKHIILASILSILALECVALSHGIDGAALAGGIAVIAGLGGYITGTKL